MASAALEKRLVGVQPAMDINKIIKELRAERDEIERAILALERVGGKRRGRPPLWMKAIEKPTEKKPRKKEPEDQET